MRGEKESEEWVGSARMLHTVAPGQRAILCVMQQKGVKVACCSIRCAPWKEFQRRNIIATFGRYRAVVKLPRAAFCSFQRQPRRLQNVKRMSFSKEINHTLPFLNSEQAFGWIMTHTCAFNARLQRVSGSEHNVWEAFFKSLKINLLAFRKQVISQHVFEMLWLGSGS